MIFWNGYRIRSTNGSLDAIYDHVLSKITPLDNKKENTKWMK